PMALNLVRAGHNVRGFDLVAEAVAALVAAGGVGAGSPAEAVKGAEVVVTMLPAGRHVDAVYQGEGGIFETASKGALFIDSSTIDVATARAVAARAESAGFAMVDAPVSGGVKGAADGALTFMVGGSETAFARAQPILEHMGKTIVHAGGSGNGQAAKICNNMILGISMIGVSEAFVLAKKLGLDAQKLFDISANASGQCWSLTTYCPVPGPVPTSPANRDYVPGFAAAMMLKDLDLAAEAAASTSAQTPLGVAARRLYQAYCDGGDGDADFSGIIRALTAGSLPD
ncbi:MAG: 3-hydroxyisobutyrate dehydrogenase, partial [Pseudomonadota bacterium]